AEAGCRGVTRRVSTAVTQRRLRRDHDGDRAGARVLLRRGLPPAVPGQESGRLLRPRRHRRHLPDRRRSGCVIARGGPHEPRRAGTFGPALLVLALLFSALSASSASSAFSGLPAPSTATAVFAGGCFWSMEHVFDGLPGVVSVTVGYAGGATKNPTYRVVE